MTAVTCRGTSRAGRRHTSWRCRSGRIGVGTRIISWNNSWIGRWFSRGCHHIRDLSSVTRRWASGLFVTTYGIGCRRISSAGRLTSYCATRTVSNLTSLVGSWRCTCGLFSRASLSSVSTSRNLIGVSGSAAVGIWRGITVFTSSHATCRGWLGCRCPGGLAELTGNASWGVGRRSGRGTNGGRRCC